MVFISGTAASFASADVDINLKYEQPVGDVMFRLGANLSIKTAEALYENPDGLGYVGSIKDALDELGTDVDVIDFGSNVTDDAGVDAARIAYAILDALNTTSISADLNVSFKKGTYDLGAMLSQMGIEALENAITDKTKVISLAAITNVVGDIRPIHEIGMLCQEKGILFVVDGAQSVPHQKTDVQKDNIDFLVFSAHKMLGPNGVGVLYGKKKYLEALRPLEYGGGMNQSFDSDGQVEYKSLPTRLEAGTPPVGEVIGLGKAIDYLESIGMDNISAYEKDLKKYLVSKLEELDTIILYNKKSDSGVLAFNIKGIFSQDTAIYLDHYHICVRAGNHCAKALKEEMNIKNTCRISLYFYNTKEEIDRFIEALKKSDDLYKIIL